jgi:hypothetical protein
MEKIFFAYAAQPEATSETISMAANSLDKINDVSASTWQQLEVKGRVVIDRVTEAIDSADLICCELGTLNPNVLFELGYAIATNKAAWVLLDTSDEDARRLWNQFGLLSSVGYIEYTNSTEIRSRILGGLRQSQPLWDDIVSASLPPAIAQSIFYMPLNHVTEASRTLTRRLERLDRQEWQITTADPTEIGAAPISWYVQHVWQTKASVIHFAAPRRVNSRIHNARCALIAGIAYGLGKQLLMLAEDQYEAPFDYRDLLKVHRSSKDLAAIFDAWLNQLRLSKGKPSSNPLVGRLKLRTALQQLNFYEYVAEQESTTLDDYFVRTKEYDSVLSSRSVIFVGRKGVGKTANMLQAASSLREDHRNFVCIIKPADYELKGLLEVLREYQGKESRSYLIENMWKFLIYSELAKTVIDQAENLPARIGRTGPVASLRDFVDRRAPSIREEFAPRLEGMVKLILKRSKSNAAGIGDARDIIGSALGGVLVRDLRKLLEAALADYTRVAILVDNLDKAWDRQADLDILSQLLLGLLTSVGRVASEFRTGAGADDVNFSLAIFLRHDIYQHLIRVAREPDKIRTASINWADANFLYRVVDERFIYSRDEGDDATELWETFFCGEVRGVPTRQYLFNRILPRPRDLLFLVNTAVANAVNAVHEQVDEEDIAKAERSYSQFAFEAALVANSITSDKLEELLFEFAGESAFVTGEDLTKALARTKIPTEKYNDVVEHLLSLEFIGREIGEERYSYGAEGPEAQRARVLARKYAERQGRPERYRVHPAFCPYLELEEV